MKHLVANHYKETWTTTKISIMVLWWLLVLFFAIWYVDRASEIINFFLWAYLVYGFSMIAFKIENRDRKKINGRKDKMVLASNRHQIEIKKIKREGKYYGMWQVVWIIPQTEESDLFGKQEVQNASGVIETDMKAYLGKLRTELPSKKIVLKEFPLSLWQAKLLYDILAYDGRRSSFNYQLLEVATKRVYHMARGKKLVVMICYCLVSWWIRYEMKRADTIMKSELDTVPYPMEEDENTSELPEGGEVVYRNIKYKGWKSQQKAQSNQNNS